MVYRPPELSMYGKSIKNVHTHIQEKRQNDRNLGIEIFLKAAKNGNYNKVLLKVNPLNLYNEK